MTHIQALARQMADRGTPHVFGIPGSGPSLDLLDALEKNGVRFHLTHFEGSGAIMAGAVGRLSGQSGVALSIKGPGLTNLLPGLAACSLENFPVVSIAEAYAPGAPLHQTHKRLNHAGLLSAVAKNHFFLSAEGPGYEHLAALAEAELPGVVHLDIAAKPGPPAALGAAAPSVQSSDGDWARLIGLVSRAQRPVIIAGTLAVRKALYTRLNHLRLPVFSTAAAKGVVDERLPQAAGVYTGVGGPMAPETALLPLSDLVVGIGIRHNEVLAAKPFSCPAVNIDPLGETHGFGFKFQHTAPGDAQQMETLFEELSAKAWGLDPLQRCLALLRARMLAADFLPAHVYLATAAHFKNNARLVLDTGNFCTIGEHAWDVPSPRLYLASGQGRYMGVGLPLAVGAAFYDASVPTVLFSGDGGIGMFVAEIKLAVQHRLPLIVVLMSDGHLGTIRGGAIQKHLTQHPAVIARPSWLDAFEGLGVGGVRIESVGALEAALAGWSMESGPLYLEAVFDPDAYQQMTDGIR
jgi:acetolactate synthase-1/2/3 large subunit